MKIKTLIGITSCVLFAVKCGKDFPEEQKRPCCVQSCKEGEQEELGDHCYFWSSNKQEGKGDCEGIGMKLSPTVKAQMEP